MKLVQRIRSKLSNTASYSRWADVNNKMEDIRVEVTFQIQTFTSEYLKLLRLCFDKTTDSIQECVYYTTTVVQIVRTTLDAFWRENSTTCQRHISLFATRVCAGVR